ncbi:uncharacterized protein C8Q71DRAFT_859901 [Rhodofomes roseus]|uniref:Uncharacterized protein n=1 Tax=Rhodofomes roseus TaxID=34475 RepID=A0ABQ8KB40_9APHY|nr:uncharacterized protein C8Q71DRAFT_859901 [Rhodofomes roseus]KAH9834244.1 hypothetical protein C8Q71DRAFT_859901 [Rhodofomes roseus]
MRRYLDAGLKGYTRAITSEKLEAVVARCVFAKQQDTAASFNVMLSRIQLACKVTSMLADKDRAYKSTQVIWDACLGHVEDALVYREFNEMCASGRKYARLAAGGSIYVLMVIALRNQRWTIRRGHVNLSTDIGNLLRWPDDSEEGKMITESIIPMVALLARTCPIKIEEIMQDSALLELNGVPAEILCSDLAISDKLFESVRSNSFVLVPRHNAAWAQFDSISKSNGTTDASNDTPSPCDREESPLTVFSEESEPRSIDAQGDCLALAMTIPTESAGVQVQTIATSYDPGHTNNSRFPACRDRNDNNEWTERARAEACGASKPADLQELETTLSTMYVSGKRRTQDSYTRVALDGVKDVLAIQGADEALLASICTSMPEAMKRSLTQRFISCFDSDPLQARTTASDPLTQPYETLHFSWYNRHCTQGHNAPQDVLPRMMRRAGVSRTNHSQLMPYPLKDMVDNAALYESLNSILEDVFAWIDGKVL